MLTVEPQVNVAPQEALQPLTAADRLFMQHHDMVTQDLLGVDYDYARDSGLIDRFYLNPETGEDGLLHILSGDILTNEAGAILPGGFHHEPSSRDNSTRVEREHLEHKGSRDSRDYREIPYNPYAAHIVIEGFRKTRTQLDAKSGEVTTLPANNGMYPKEYDALAVLQTVRKAVDERDVANDVVHENTITNDTTVTLLDGQTPMKLRLLLDRATGKVLTAYPGSMSKKKMTLTRDEIKQHLGL